MRLYTCLSNLFRVSLLFNIYFNLPFPSYTSVYVPLVQTLSCFLCVLTLLLYPTGVLRGYFNITLNQVLKSVTRIFNLSLTKMISSSTSRSMKLTLFTVKLLQKRISNLQWPIITRLITTRRDPSGQPRVNHKRQDASRCPFLFVSIALSPKNSHWLLFVNQLLLSHQGNIQNTTHILHYPYQTINPAIWLSCPSSLS